MMFGFGYGGGVIWMLVMAVLLVVPFWKILPRYGLPAWAALFAVIPVGALILLWVVAFKDKVDGTGEAS